ncbi:hypothetical protein KP509_31G049800 [Ceratopteris richardii]|uniref:Uncharacterized protein n=1 Tax=Ceratopteris richardii TaxID=49495 RepID=A0A8T2QZN3_CERRI|nr:hypothetical protein KP509_31G049800 [Ceratopteris richardii]
MHSLVSSRTTTVLLPPATQSLQSVCPPLSSTRTASRSSSPKSLLVVRSAPSCRMTAASLSPSTRCGKRIKQKCHYLFCFLASLLLQRHTVLLLVPMFYFYGMVLMMEQGESGVQHSSSTSPTPQNPPQQQQQDDLVNLLIPGDGWRQHLLEMPLQRGSRNGTSLDIFFCRTGHFFFCRTRLSIWEPQI